MCIHDPITFPLVVPLAPSQVFDLAIASLAENQLDFARQYIFLIIVCAHSKFLEVIKMYTMEHNTS